MLYPIAQEIDFLAPPKTPMGGPREPKILSVMSLPFYSRAKICADVVQPQRLEKTQ
jgi:hypothetical protein